MSFLYKNLGFVYFILPYLKVSKNIVNKKQLIFSILFGSNNFIVKLNDKSKLKFTKSQYTLMLNYVGLLSFCTSYRKISSEKLEISFDEKNVFTLPITNFSVEDQNLIELLFHGLKFGANFCTKQPKIETRENTLFIFEQDGKKIVETSKGVKFYLDSIVPQITIIETFIQKNHSITLQDDWSNKIIVNGGAHCGDTPLYYASLGASKIYAFEPSKINYNFMIKNLELNPTLASKIEPINAALGKDGDLTFYESMDPVIKTSPSFVYNTHGKNAKLTKAKGYSFESAFKKFGINHVDLLQMDCKGCEFYLTETILKLADIIEMETAAYDDYKLSDLLSLLKKSNFDYMLYRNNPFDPQSTNESTHIYARKING